MKNLIFALKYNFCMCPSQIKNIVQFCRLGRSSSDGSVIAWLDGDTEALKEEGC